MVLGGWRVFKRGTPLRLRLMAQQLKAHVGIWARRAPVWAVTIKTSAALYGANRGTHTQHIAYHTIGVWGAGSDDVGLIQRTKAPWM